MSEECTVQQQKSTTAGCSVGGAILGGGAGAYLALGKPKWAYDKPKYASFSDIVKESHDDFVRNNEGIGEAVLNEQNRLNIGYKKAGQFYDKELEKFINENKETINKTDKYKELEAQLSAATKSKNKLSRELNQALKNNTGNTNPALTPDKAIELINKMLAEKNDEIQRLKALLNDELKNCEKIVKSPEELKVMFEQMHGRKEEAIKQVLDDISGEASDDIKKLLEKGKGKRFGLKVAGIIAGFTALGVMIGRIFAPKGNK